jgi:hypothetical protein
MKINNKQEYIICAAIHIQDNKNYPHQPKNIKSGYVICGRRHHNCIQSIAILKDILECKKPNTQGFLTNQNNFLNREDAKITATKANQINNTISNKLTSEDLY